MRHVALLAALLMAAHAWMFWGAGPFDDDFICYRYARNLIEGHGLVFQPGEVIEGFTNPLWVLLVAAALELGIEPTVFSRAVGVLAAAVAVWAVGDAWRARYGTGSLSPALVVAVLPPMAWHAVTGLGTTLLAALLALWFRAWDRAREEGRVPWSAGVWLALACLLRQEAALFALVFLAGERRRMPVLLPLAVLAGWTLFRWFTYGQLLPMPWYVKKLPLAADLEYGARYVGVSTLTCGIALLSLLAPAARKGWRPLGVGVLLHTAYVVIVGGDFMALARFHVPVLPLAVLAASSALRERAPRALLPAGLVLAVGVQWVQVPWSLAFARARPLVFEQTRSYRFLDHEVFEERWARIGRVLRDTCPAGTSVATSPIGAIGWYSRLPLIDILGLTNDATLGVEPDLEAVGVKGHHRFDAAWVMERRPDLVLLGNGVLDQEWRTINPWERTLFAHPDFRSGYVPILLEIPGDEPLRLWMRRDTAPPEGARVAR
jgi:arabinofuranosyltransferase